MRVSCLYPYKTLLEEDDSLSPFHQWLDFFLTTFAQRLVEKLIDSVLLGERFFSGEMGNKEAEALNIHHIQND
ncbi:hypothetical protein CDG77_33655 [Nostoc sp. 'Peltigera membranacea cyanobiont' 213]|nr:hypothetical protein CDG77_33655 [Nostoc sp. 'Peltigera membranacea cyanobiont' 213]